MPSEHPSPPTDTDHPVAAELDRGPIRPAEAEPLAIEDIRDALVIRENGMFLLMDKNGNVPRVNRSGFGLYHGDTRFLSRYEFSFSQTQPVMLLSTAALGFACEQVSTNATMETLNGESLRRESIQVRRQRILGQGLEERVRITSFHDRPVVLELRYSFAADFADIFEIRGVQRPTRGQLQAVERGGRTLTYSYLCRDHVRLSTRIEFSTEPVSLGDHDAFFHVRLEPQQTIEFSMVITAVQGDEPPSAAPTDRLAVLEHQYRQWRRASTHIQTNNEIFNAVLGQSLNDLRMLWNNDVDGGALAAGTPWFDTVFGRDSAVTSLQMLAFNPAIAKQTLRLLAARQGTEVNAWRDEEPGKILHETRQGEMSRTQEVPFALYYGSIDSTPLFLLLAAEYWAWTADNRLIRELMPAIRRALDWVDRFGDRDGDGYLEYERFSENGLLNQGWKDSGDAIVGRDGSFARPPIALVEVQGYLYAAFRGLSRVMASRLDAKLAVRLSERAEALKRQINQDFWLDEGFYAVALDGDKRQVDSITSNPGHLLYAGAAPPQRAAQVVRRMLSADLFSGWGIRTLSADSPRFNPLGYHLGTIWPHDNSITAMGFKKYGKESELLKLATVLFDAAKTFDYYRLPELFCGTPRSSHHAPVPYPVACRPQAWAAGTIPFLLQAILGLCPDASRNELLVVRPQLPSWLEQVQVNSLRVGNASVDLLYELHTRRTLVTVLNATAGLRVSVVNRWPL